MTAAETAERRLEVILFSGGRGSGALTRQLVRTPHVALTIAINGYDDGASTGEVRRFLGDCLGPSDFRKNASRLASELGTCPPALIDLLDSRLPADAADDRAVALVRATAGRSEFPAVGERLNAFLCERQRSRKPFHFPDCSLGNLVFAGSFLLRGRDFNSAVDDYCALVALPAGLIENVTSGTNAWLVALDVDGRLLATEEAIVDGTRPNRIREIFLIDRSLMEDEARTPDVESRLAARRAPVSLNPRLAQKIAAADLIIYAPGTQHSSLFPSYLTSGLSAAIAANLTAIKLLLTNIQPDAEISGSSAVEIIDRAVYYLKEKGRQTIPTPCLITHYLVNDPGSREPEEPYVPLGPLETIEDPRLVRIGNYEDGITGRHDASRVLAPFLEAIAHRRSRQRVAVLLHDARSVNTVAQTLLEMVRGGIERVPVDVSVFYQDVDPLDAAFTGSLPFVVRRLHGGRAGLESALREGFDYVALFESDGMYRGEDLVALMSHLVPGRLDAVWGSRRLSVRDIEESYRLRYRKNALLGTISYVGSHVLSLAYLAAYGRYVFDTLSAVWAVRASDALTAGVDLTHKQANHLLLTHLLGRKAEILEIPVQFFPISPQRVKRTSPLDGFRALGTIVRRRLSPGRA